MVGSSSVSSKAFVFDRKRRTPMERPIIRQRNTKIMERTAILFGLCCRILAGDVGKHRNGFFGSVELNPQIPWLVLQDLQLEKYES